MKKSTTNNRNYAFDIARSLCALEIIGFWHVLAYINAEKGNVMVWGGHLTVFCLSVFTFISGYFMSRYKFEIVSDVKLFFKKRLVRFFPLFFLSASSLYVGGLIMNHSWFVDIKQFILTVTGFSCFAPPMVGTLWYISMLMFFYMITPVLSCGKYNKWIAFALCFIIGANKITQIDSRFFMYMPVYILGLWFPDFFAKKINEYAYNHKMLLFVCSVFLLCLDISIYGLIDYNPFFRFVAILIGTCSILFMSFVLSSLKWILPFFSFLAYSSMAAYLFHRQIYECFRILMPDRIIPLALMLIAIVVCFCLSYVIQKIYDYGCRILLG